MGRTSGTRSSLFNSEKGSALAITMGLSAMSMFLIIHAVKTQQHTNRVSSDNKQKLAAFVMLENVGTMLKSSYDIAQAQDTSTAQWGQPCSNGYGIWVQFTVKQSAGSQMLSGDDGLRWTCLPVQSGHAAGEICVKNPFKDSDVPSCFQMSANEDGQVKMTANGSGSTSESSVWNSIYSRYTSTTSAPNYNGSPSGGGYTLPTIAGIGNPTSSTNSFTAPTLAIGVGEGETPSTNPKDKDCNPTFSGADDCANSVRNKYFPKDQNYLQWDVADIVYEIDPRFEKIDRSFSFFALMGIQLAHADQAQVWLQAPKTNLFKATLSNPNISSDAAKQAQINANSMKCGSSFGVDCVELIACLDSSCSPEKTVSQMYAFRKMKITPPSNPGVVAGGPSGPSGTSSTTSTTVAPGTPMELCWKAPVEATGGCSVSGACMVPGQESGSCFQMPQSNYQCDLTQSAGGEICAKFDTTNGNLFGGSVISQISKGATCTQVPQGTCASIATTTTIASATTTTQPTELCWMGGGSLASNNCESATGTSDICSSAGATNGNCTYTDTQDYSMTCVGGNTQNCQGGMVSKTYNLGAITCTAVAKGTCSSQASMVTTTTQQSAGGGGSGSGISCIDANNCLDLFTVF